MSTNTSNMAMGKAVDGDNAKTYLETTLGAALDKIDVHTHGGTTLGLSTLGSISATGIALLSGNMALTTGQYLSNGSARIRLKDLGTVANAAVVAVDDVAASCGILFIVYGGGGVAAYVLTGGNHTTAVLFQGGAGSTFTSTFNNAATINVYWNTTDYFLQNNGGSNSFATFFLSNS